MIEGVKTRYRYSIANNFFFIFFIFIDNYVNKNKYK